MNTPIKLKQHRHPGLWDVPVQHHTTLKVINSAVAQPATGSTSEVAKLLQQVARQGDSSGRWITLIGQPDFVERNNPNPSASSIKFIERLLQQAGINKHQVRWIRPNNSDSKAWAAEQALLLNNSAVVIAWLGDCSTRDWQRLELARKCTDVKSLIYGRSSALNQPQTPLH